MVGIGALPIAGRNISIVGRVAASAGRTLGACAPWTSDSTSIGVNGSVGVSSVGAVRSSGGRIAVVWVLEWVRRGTAVRSMVQTRRQGEATVWLRK
jgi:hypothetical protein